MQSEPADSINRFWLASCIEAYLRGNNTNNIQLYIAQTGILYTIISEIKGQTGLGRCINMQSSFDLLGEIIKCNIYTITMLEYYLGQNYDQFNSFMKIIMKNLVDSNVFIRSLYLTIYSLSIPSSTNQHESSTNQHPINRPNQAPNPAYLTHSWVQFNPNPLVDLSRITAYHNNTSSNTNTTGRKGNNTNLRATSKTPLSHLMSSFSHSSSRMSRSPIVTEGRLVHYSVILQQTLIVYPDCNIHAIYIILCVLGLC